MLFFFNILSKTSRLFLLVSFDLTLPKKPRFANLSMAVEESSIFFNHNEAVLLKSSIAF